MFPAEEIFTGHCFLNIRRLGNQVLQTAKIDIRTARLFFHLISSPALALGFEFIQSSSPFFMVFGNCNNVAPDPILQSTSFPILLMNVFKGYLPISTLLYSDEQSFTTLSFLISLLVLNPFIHLNLQISSFMVGCVATSLYLLMR